ncbi:ADQ_G0022790.mRNA.1.CDS.1 [Saccharomyces cerevisiae]|nr:ADQ_G0022790.mRNA.1.CDS.1 [Saccharomyces cerevisiae]CAI5276094.1 CMF_HP2_G0021380.mRNA.1.CDS.1 [Saccharomyces cerevisiae]CAI6525651.1 CMF_HP2_G0021380.mRNA.1.CDS.1 [Saccharomyces cerevisiae]CAI6545112.1 CMF_HP1_G0022750.mRNA.1.CDS.1 [Saccharomyces cerevisiae]CAI6697347.1 ADQ_G0022790.mRNA.1.CDS.1 [Saccharomyces cerevisiae]
MTLTKQTCAKQACDCCRIRRVKCDGKRPCSSCLQNSLDCTYLQPSRKRGPKSIRLRSLKRIAEVQRESGPNTIATAPVIYKRVPKKLIDQCLRLYHDNLYVIWPLLSYDDLHKLLEEKYNDNYVYWFLTALSAATLSDLQTEIKSEEEVTFTGKQLSNLCISSCQQFDDLDNSNIFNIMTYYCLHRSFAQISNARTSYRLCCEAVGLITVAGLHREETYGSLTFEEQQLRRKLYYLLLMTERYYAIYLHCATSLDATIAPPQPEPVTDPRLSLDSFLEMIRVFTVPGKCFFDALATDSSNASCDEDSLKKIWKELHTASLEIEPWSYGYVDIAFSRHWIRVLAWKLVLRTGNINFLSASNSAHVPIEIARDMLDDVFLTPNNLYGVHGPGIPTKAIEVANALVDVMNQYDQDTESEAWKVLCEISKFVFSLKQYDGKLVENFVTKCQSALITLPISKPLKKNEDLHKI